MELELVSEASTDSSYGAVPTNGPIALGIQRTQEKSH